MATKPAKKKTKATEPRHLFDGLRSSIAQAPAALGAPPDGYRWNKLFPFGTRYRSDFPDGSMSFDRSFFDAMVQNFAKLNGRDLPVDYFHRGTSDQSPVPNDSKIAAGWIGRLQVVGNGGDETNDGLWAAFKWTDKARAHILADELRYLSPTFTEAGVDRTTGLEQGPTLFGAALLNDPFLQDLPKVAAAAHPTYPEHRRMDHATACKHLGLDPDATTPEQLAQHMAKAGAAYAKGGKPAGAAPAADDADGVEPSGADGDHTEPDGDEPPAAGAGGAVHVHVHNEGAAVKKTKKNLSASPSDSGDVATMKREFAAQMQQVGTRLSAIETENKQLKAEKKTRDHDDLVRDLLRGDHIDASQKAEVVEMAAAIGVEKAKAFFGKFKRGLQGSVSLNIDAEGVSDAKTPEQAMTVLNGQISKMVKELNIKEPEAMARVYGAAENGVLLALANSTSRPR